MSTTPVCPARIVPVPSGLLMGRIGGDVSRSAIQPSFVALSKAIPMHLVESSHDACVKVPGLGTRAQAGAVAHRRWTAAGRVGAQLAAREDLRKAEQVERRRYLPSARPRGRVPRRRNRFAARKACAERAPRTRSARRCRRQNHFAAQPVLASSARRTLTARMQRSRSVDRTELAASAPTPPSVSQAAELENFARKLRARASRVSETTTALAPAPFAKTTPASRVARRRRMRA